MAFRAFGGHGGGFRYGMAHDPEKAKEHAAFAVAWAFRAVDATEEQKAHGRVARAQGGEASCRPREGGGSVFEVLLSGGD